MLKKIAGAACQIGLMHKNANVIRSLIHIRLINAIRFVKRNSKKREKKEEVLQSYEFNEIVDI